MIRLSMIGPIVASLGSSPIPPLLSSALEEKITISKVLETWNAHLNFSKSFGVANSVFIPFTEIKIVSRRIRNLHPPIFSRLLEFSWMLSMAFVRVTSFEEEEESAFELLSSFSEQQKGCYQQQRRFYNDFVPLHSHLFCLWHPWHTSPELIFCPSKFFGSPRSFL